MKNDALLAQKIVTKKLKIFWKYFKNIGKISIDIGQKTLCIRYGPLWRKFIKWERERVNNNV